MDVRYLRTSQTLARLRKITGLFPAPSKGDQLMSTVWMFLGSLMLWEDAPVAIPFTGARHLLPVVVGPRISLKGSNVQRSGCTRF